MPDNDNHVLQAGLSCSEVEITSVIREAVNINGSHSLVGLIKWLEVLAGSTLSEWNQCRGAKNRD